MRGLRINRRDFLRLAAAGAALPSLSQLSGCGGGPSEHVPVIVIGSGFGGAVASLRLAQAGVPVLLLERGRRWPITPAGDTFSSQLAPDGRSTWLRDRTALPLGFDYVIDPYIGVLERTDHEGIQVYAGAGYGGGSLVYGCMSVQPQKDVFEQVFPSAMPYDDLAATYYPRVRTMLSLAAVPDPLYQNGIFDAARVFRSQAAAASLPTFLVESATDWSVVQRELDGQAHPSAINGELIFGANSGYKNSLDKNYLAMAEATGLVSVRTQHQVSDIERDGERYIVHCEQIDELGAVAGKTTLSCDSLFLAAGSMGTTSLLVKARATGGLPELNDMIGTGWGSNGNAMFMRSTVGQSTGAVQALPPVTGISWPDSPLGPVLVEHAPYPSGLDCQCLLSLGCALTSGRGSFRYDQATRKVVLNYPSAGNDEAVAVVRQVADALNSANGGTLSRDLFHEDADITRGFTYHPLGGAVMGLACDYFGRVMGYPGLYVVDSALMPGSSACANPSLTIAAIAERCLERILAEDFV